MPPKENEIEQSELFALEEQVADLKNALYDARKQLKSAICIPENATNGDMIKTVFPGCEDWKATIKPATGEAHDTHFVQLPNNMTINKLDESWWNAPYKEAEE